MIPGRLFTVRVLELIEFFLSSRRGQHSTTTSLSITSPLFGLLPNGEAISISGGGRSLLLAIQKFDSSIQHSVFSQSSFLSQLSYCKQYKCIVVWTAMAFNYSASNLLTLLQGWCALMLPQCILWCLPNSNPIVCYIIFYQLILNACWKSVEVLWAFYGHVLLRSLILSWLRILTAEQSAAESKNPRKSFILVGYLEVESEMALCEFELRSVGSNICLWKLHV